MAQWVKGQWNNLTHNHSNSSGGSRQMQRQRYAQSQKTADMQMFKEQVDNTFISIEQAALMSQNGKWGSDIVNSATDGAVLTLDMFAVTCGEFCSKADKDALDLAKKTVYDKWNELKLRDKNTFNLTTKYRDFLIAALNGEKHLRFKTYRRASSQLDINASKELSSNPDALHDTYQYLISSNQKFDKEQGRIRNNADAVKAIKHNHDRELYEYRNTKQYQSNNHYGSYNKPKQSDFYFTKSGQNAQFERMNIESEQRELENETYGDNEIDEYSKLPSNLLYQNAVIKLSNKHKMGKVCKPIPCKILYPKNKSKVYDAIHVRPAFPHNGKVMSFSVNMICYDTKYIKKIEAKHIEKYGKLGDNYPSIETQENMMDEDGWE